MPGCDTLHVSVLRSDLAELGPERETLCNRVRGDDRVCTARKRVRERRRVAGATGKLDRLAAQPLATLPRRFVARRSWEAGKEPRAELNVAFGDRSQSFLEQRHQALVCAGP
jgi:hypothetical protein